MGKILRFAVLVGLRSAEVCESVRLLNGINSCSADIGDAQTCRRYYNPERQALEHFRFRDIFLRQTKKAFISFVTPEMLGECKFSTSGKFVTYQDVRYACWSASIKCDMRYCRKLFASHLRNEGIQPEIVDLLQGRVASSVLTRHYLVPKPTFKEEVLQALNGLKKEIEN